MTKTAGVLFFALAAIALALAISNYTGQFVSAAEIAQKYKDTGITTTDLRFAMGVSFVVEILVAAGLALVGWFLFGSETEQYAYLIATGVLLLASIVIRVAPVLPISAARVSPTLAFFGSQVRLSIIADDTVSYVTLPPSPQYRVGRVKAPSEKQAAVLLDFRGNQSLMQTYLQSTAPATVVGSVSGTRTLWQPQSKAIFMVPRVKVYKVGGK